MALRVLAGCTAAALLASDAAGDTITVQLAGSHVEAIGSGGVRVPFTDLRPGVSRGPVADHPWSTTIRSADSRNLDSYFIRDNTAGHWEILLGTFSPSPGPAADFFLFDVGGNDEVTVSARFADGTIGRAVVVDGWSPTAVVAVAGPNIGQRVHGLAFRFEELRDAVGDPLDSGDEIQSLLVHSRDIDGAAFLVREDGVHAPAPGDGSASVRPGRPSALSPVQVTFEGPWASETGTEPNPFLDLRMTVRFDGPAGRTITVPGFFDADGGRGDSGNAWAARFLPPVPGQWTATVSMRRGPDVTASIDPAAGTAEPILDGRAHSFLVEPLRPEATGYHRLGTLKDVGRHHRKFEFGPYFLKAGTNSPENFLAIRCLDDVTKSGGEGVIHSYSPHVQDWREGDPILDRGNVTDDGRGVIGALNYLSDAGVNSLFVMVMNLGGDGRDVHPFIGPRRRAFDKTRYDTSRLRQWDQIFSHAQARGISLSLVLNETEIDNELWLDHGRLGVERKVFYRELIARFGHHPAIRWNVCEENDFDVPQLDAFAGWIKSLDGDMHPVAIHNNPNDLSLFQSLASNANFDAASLQFDPNLADAQVEQVRAWSQQAGRPWVVDADEQGPWQIGLTDQNAADSRKRILYDALFSGGGVEFYFGYHPLPLGGDLNLEDFRTRAEMWNAVSHARALIEDRLPFWDMEPSDSLVQGESPAFGGAECLAKPGEIYAIYFPRAADTGSLVLEAITGSYQLEWYDPRTGEYAGETVDLGPGGATRDLPSPPYDAGNDWVALVRRGPVLSGNRQVGSISRGDLQRLTLDAGSSFAGRGYFWLSSFSGTTEGFTLDGLDVPIDFDRLTRFGINDAQGLIFRGRTGVLDAEGRASMGFQLNPLISGGLAGMTIHHCVITTEPFDWTSNVITLQVIP
ncbi:MAG: DUF5060 domain-containing protein [Planctomycetota bacterium]|nr:DUF5060 domain-containing protein [Planctomycetota bacterium]